MSEKSYCKHFLKNLERDSNQQNIQSNPNIFVYKTYGYKNFIMLISHSIRRKKKVRNVGTTS